MYPGNGGQAYETAVVKYLRDRHPASFPHRINQPSFKDRGDIRFSTVVLQAKTSPVGLVTVGRYVDDAVVQAERHHTDVPLLPAAVARRPGRPDIGEDLVILRMSDFVALVAERDTLSSDTPE